MTPELTKEDWFALGNCMAKKARQLAIDAGAPPDVAGALGEQIVDERRLVLHQIRKRRAAGQEVDAFFPDGFVERARQWKASGRPWEEFSV